MGTTPSAGRHGWRRNSGPLSGERPACCRHSEEKPAASGGLPLRTPSGPSSWSNSLSQTRSTAMNLGRGPGVDRDGGN